MRLPEQGVRIATRAGFGQVVVMVDLRYLKRLADHPENALSTEVKAAVGKSRINETQGQLDRLLFPLPISQFLADYFNRKPLFIRGKPKKFDFLFREDEFAKRIGQLTEIRAVFANHRQAQIKAVAIADMLDAGATICITGMEQVHERLAAAAKAVAAEIGYSGLVDFRAYLSPPGAGFDLHYDARVVTTLQISGSKRWWYSEELAEPFPMENSPRRDNSPETADCERPPQKDMTSVLLRPGDVLCLPAGAWHRAEADADSSLALNMAFNYSGAGAVDQIAFALSARLQRQPEWRMPIDAGPPDQDRTAYLAAMRARLSELQSVVQSLQADDQALLDAWKSWITRTQA